MDDQYAGRAVDKSDRREVPEDIEGAGVHERIEQQSAAVKKQGVSIRSRLDHRTHRGHDVAAAIVELTIVNAAQISERAA